MWLLRTHQLVPQRLAELGNDDLLGVLEESKKLGFLGPGPVSAHIEHAARFLEAVDAPPHRVLDLGSGGGVPGLVLALQWQCEWTLLDVMAKRCRFLTFAVATLGLSDRVAVLEGRAEELARNESHRGNYDLVVARSFGPPAVTAECSAGFLSLGGVLVVSEPPGESAARWEVDGLRELGLEVVDQPNAQVVKLRAAELCPDRYPRRVGIPAKRPLF